MIVSLVDAIANLVKFLILPGQAHDMTGVAPLIKGGAFGALLADKALDADWLLKDARSARRQRRDPPRSDRNAQRDHDTEVHKWRHMDENYFAKIKEFRGIASR